MKVLKAKKHAKTRKPQAETVEKAHTAQPEKQSSASEPHTGGDSTHQVCLMSTLLLHFSL